MDATPHPAVDKDNTLIRGERVGASTEGSSEMTMTSDFVMISPL